MNDTRFKTGDMLISDCGDFGVVLKTGPRPDDDGNRIMGVYAHWAKEGFSFWVDMDEPTIELYCSKGDR